MTDLLTLAADVPWPSGEAETATRDRIAQLAVPTDSLGRLAELAEWLGGVQDTSPPRPPSRPHLVVLTTGTGTEVGPLVRDELAMSVRSVPVDDLDIETALTVGAGLADDAADADADLVILGHAGDATLIPAAALISLLAATEPVRVVGRRQTGDVIDDARWIADLTAVRDLRRRAAAHRAEPATMLTEVGDPMLAAMTAFLLRAAGRRTSVLLDAVPVLGAALVARELAPRAIRWWQLSHQAPDPAHRAATERLRLTPLLDLGAVLDGGAGAVLALPLLSAAARLVADLPLDPARAPAATPSAGVGGDEWGLDDADGDGPPPDIEQEF